MTVRVDQFQFQLIVVVLSVQNCHKIKNYLFGQTRDLNVLERNKGITLGDGNSLKCNLAAKSWELQSGTAAAAGPKYILASCTLRLNKHISGSRSRPTAVRSLSLSMTPTKKKISALPSMEGDEDATREDHL